MGWKIFQKNGLEKAKYVGSFLKATSFVISNIIAGTYRHTHTHTQTKNLRNYVHT